MLLGKKISKPIIDFEYKGDLVFQCYEKDLYDQSIKSSIYTVTSEIYKDIGSRKYVLRLYHNGKYIKKVYKVYSLSPILDSSYDLVNSFVMDNILSVQDMVLNEDFE
jgi:hypothetical protein